MSLDGQLTVRRAVSADLSRLLDLYQHLVPGDDRPDDATAEVTFGRFLSYQGSAILLGEVQGFIAATCTLVIVPNLTRGARSYALIENVVTHTLHRNRGYARHLLDAACNAAWLEDCYKVMLLTGSQDPAILGFYERAGFEKTKTGFQKRRIPARHEF